LIAHVTGRRDLDWRRPLGGPWEGAGSWPGTLIHRMRFHVGVDMSFSIERYKEESKKVDVTGVAWGEVTSHPLSKGDLFCPHYMMDIENHVPLYLSHLLITRACMDPILTAFLA
jgi:hypothetical protein